MFQNKCHQLELQLFYLTRSLCILRSFSQEIPLTLSCGMRMVLSSRSKAADIAFRKLLKIIHMAYFN